MKSRGMRNSSRPAARFLREVIGHFEVDIIGRKQLFARPAFVDDLGQFLRDIEAPAIVPAVVEPRLQLLAGVVVEDIDVQLALARQPGEGEVAAAHKAGDGIIGIGAVQQVQFGVQLVAQEQLDDEPAASQFPAEAAQACLVLVRGRADEQLLAKLLRHAGFEAHDGSLVHLLRSLEAENLAQFVFRLLLHADQQAAAALLVALPALHQAIDGAPAAQVEIADAEIGALGYPERILQGFEQFVFDIVEDTRHGLQLSNVFSTCLPGIIADADWGSNHIVTHAVCMSAAP